MSLTFAGSAFAGKGTDNRTSAPSAAAQATQRVSPRIDAINETKADMKDSTKFLHCQTRGCLHGH
jgi:hypothetical protein